MKSTSNYSMHKEKVRVGNYNWNKLKFFCFFKGRQPKMGFLGVNSDFFKGRQSK